MFVLARMVDTVRLEPFRFKKDGAIQKALEKALNFKFANKVVLNVGLCICFYDFEKIGDSLIIPGDGASHTKVNFRYMVFRPFVDEVITAKIKSCHEHGIDLSLGFYDDIFIPSDKLQFPSNFKDNAWVWEYQTGEEGETHSLYMEPGGIVRFRVVEEEFVDTQPSTGGIHAEHIPEDGAEKKIPYSILGSMSEPGLGCVDWWTSNTEEETPMEETNE